MTQALIIGVSILVGILIIGIIFSRLYKRSSKGLSYVRTGWGGLKVISDGGAIIVPVLHETIDVNMNTLRLEVSRKDSVALITKDRLRIDVVAEFYVRVKPDETSIAQAAQTLGIKTLNPNDLRENIEGKLVDSLRAVAAKMNMNELHENRENFVQQVQQSVSGDLEKNGLELESVSLTGLDQTNIKFFSADNLFDAVGLTTLTETIQDRNKKRNEIEQDASLAIKQKNLETQMQSLNIEREEENAKSIQAREVANIRASQATEIAKVEAEQRQLAENAKIEADRHIKLNEISANAEVERQEIHKKQEIEIANQNSQIEIARKSEEQSQANAAADKARLEAVKAEEQVKTVRETEVAERIKQVEIIEATAAAEKSAVGIKVQAEAEKEAAENLAQARLIDAEASKKAEILSAEGKQKIYEIEAEGQRKVNEAKNTLSTEQVAFEVQQLLIKTIPQIIAESVKPMENIDSIKILDLNNGGSNNTGLASIGGSSNDASNISDQVVNSALKFRTQAPLVDALLSELGMSGRTLDGIVAPLKELQQHNSTSVNHQSEIQSNVQADGQDTSNIDAHDTAHNSDI